MMKRAIFVALMGLAACGGGTKANTSTMSTHEAPLYDRLGKLDAIKAVVKDFVEEQVAKDDRINAKFFANADLPHLEQMLVDQICEATGGPCKYTGKSMKEVHTGMGVDEAAWTALVEDLAKSLAKFNVGKTEQDELVGALAKMHDDVVEKK